MTLTYLNSNSIYTYIHSIYIYIKTLNRLTLNILTRDLKRKRKNERNNNNNNNNNKLNTHTHAHTHARAFYEVNVLHGMVTKTQINTIQ